MALVSTMSPLNRWRHRSRTFWTRLLRRDSPESGPVTLNRRRIYILPTRNGLILALVLFAMLLGAINYNNSLAYALTFLITGLSVVSIIHTFRNLNGLHFSAGHPHPLFAGEQACFPLSVEAPGNHKRFALQLQLAGQTAITHDLEGQDQHWIEIRLPTRVRGRLKLPRVTVTSCFPLGLFRAWGYLHLDSDTIVYPTPAAESNLPAQLLQLDGATGDRGRGSDDFAALRPYHPGDSLRHIHWKALAREQGLQTKLFGGDRLEEVWLRWGDLAGMDIENRLSTLCRWVLEAEKADLGYGLELPERCIEPGRGELHRRQCLEALALYGKAP